MPSSPPCRLLSTRLTPFAQRSREATKITEAISAVLAANSETNLLEIEEVFRDAGSSVYLIAEPERTIVIGMSAVRSTGLACRRKKADMRWQAFTTADQHSVRGPPCGAPGERKIPPARCPRY